MVVLLLLRASRRGRCYPWDGAGATFSTSGSVLSSRTCFWPSPPWGAHTAEREPARTQADPLTDWCGRGTVAGVWPADDGCSTPSPTIHLIHLASREAFLAVSGATTRP